MKNIKLIIERKKNGIDCTEEESAEIKYWLKETLLSMHDGSVEVERDLQVYFPLEYAEYLTPDEYIVQYCDSLGNVINVPYHLDSVEVISRGLREVGIFNVYC